MKTFSHHIFAYAVAAMALALWCVPAVRTAAQKRTVMNRPYIDQRRFHYGFMVGVHMQDLELVNNGFVDENGNQWWTEIPHYEPGFSVGLLGETYINKYLALRAVPSMHFGTKNVTFRNEADGSRDYQTIKSTYISVPIDVKYSAERFNNYRPYLMAGVNPMFDLTVKKQNPLLLKPFDVYIECGMGCDFYLPFFKFIPELKFCWGLSNMIDHDRSDLSESDPMVISNSVGTGRSKMIVLTLYFE